MLRQVPEPLPQKQTVVDKYRRFLQRHEPSLDLIEHVMERFVFYGYLFKHDHRGISAEMYYAAWNTLRWVNDVVLVGWGDGMGTTVGMRGEWLGRQQRLTSLENSGERKRLESSSSSEWMLARMGSIVPMLRAVLTATTCVYPAMEAWSRRSLNSHLHPLGTPLWLDGGTDGAEEYKVLATTTDLSPQRRRQEWEARQRRTATVSHRLERVKFLARLALLSISWWAQQQRRKRSREDGNAVDESKSEQAPLPSLLKRGGELDPYEQSVSLKEAEDEARVVRYVGRRTGRRSVARTPVSAAPPRQSRGDVHSVAALVKWISGLMPSKNRVFYIYAVGELLHILRPLYWSSAENNHWRSRSSDEPSQKQQKPSPNSFYSFGIWKAWWVALLMDLISDKLLRLPQGGDAAPPSNTPSRRRGSFYGRGGGRHSGNVPSPSAEQAKLDELDWRRSRLGLYLLRSPVYDVATRPLATFMGKALSMIPSFGLGQWAAEYILDMMSYWNGNHFMLES